MKRLKRILAIIAHPHELRLALSGLGIRLGGDGNLGSLTKEETEAVVRWAAGADKLIEIGTLFGFTAKAVALRTKAKVTAVDNFSWNPFGLTSSEHRRFTEKVLEGSGVELVEADSAEYLSALDCEGALVFLDGDHSYDGVRRELEILNGKRCIAVAGHDFGNPNFGVTKAVGEVLGKPDEVVGRCWVKWSKEGRARREE